MKGQGYRLAKQDLFLETFYRLVHLTDVFQVVGTEGVCGTAVVGKPAREHLANVCAQLLIALACH